jgi:integrase
VKSARSGPKRIEVKEGNIVVPIYEFSDGRFCVDIKLGEERIRIARASLDAAKIEARRLIAQISAGRFDEDPLTKGEAEDYRLAKNKIEGYGESLLSVVEDWIAYQERTTQLEKKSASAVVAEFLNSKELDGVSTLHLADRRFRLRKFALAFPGQIARVTTPEVKQWLHDLKGSRRTTRNYRNAALQLFRFARSQGYLPKNTPTVIEEIEVNGVHEGDIQIYTSSELRLLLEHAPKKLIPFFCIGAFAGLRSQEIMRLEWNDVRFGQGFIEVSAKKSKTASRRLVPLQPALKKWLKGLRKESGRVMEYAHNAGLVRARQRFCESGITVEGKIHKFEWKPNALRHSYASYRLADIKDAARVALEMGNSPAMLFRNYRELVTEQQAKEWFSLFPPREVHRSGRKIIPYPLPTNKGNNSRALPRARLSRK